MNFVSHYFIDGIKDNHYHNLGLIMPDLFGFLEKRVRFNEKTINQLVAQKGELPIYTGMRKHIKLDIFFHSSNFFRDIMKMLQDFAELRGFQLRAFQTHILIEMLIDKFIIHKAPEAPQGLYASLRAINVNDVIDSLSNLKNLDHDDIKSLLTRIARSSYMAEYDDLYTIITICNKVNSHFTLAPPLCLTKFSSVLDEFYQNQADTIDDFLYSLRSTHPHRM